MIETKIGFLIVLNFFLILVGCMMDIFSATLIVVPLIMQPTSIRKRFRINKNPILLSTRPSRVFRIFMGMKASTR